MKRRKIWLLVKFEVVIISFHHYRKVRIIKINSTSTDRQLARMAIKGVIYLLCGVWFGLWAMVDAILNWIRI